MLSDRSADGRWPNAAFAPALEHSDVGRRGWQMLSSLFKRAVSRTELVATNPSTRPRRPTAWWQSLNGTVRWMKGTGSCGLLLPALRRRPNSPLVDRVRQQIQAALPHDDYINLIRLLARFTEAL